ncbi:hypothetical protein CEXT_589851 [Caerostris extrusa]|uniref:Uncharacterized protein n=1 Tax=Caerostris extrusa TaxID=172846 RepID=A0AAV4SDI8_CAEEX|nr:hypothetical protein CEXT_589851 [Caerostris extrusa]
MQLSISNYDILSLENDLRCLSTKKADKSRSPKSNYPKYIPSGNSFNKTVLDLSKERGLHLLADYFEENKASESSKIYAPSEKVPDV